MEFKIVKILKREGYNSDYIEEFLEFYKDGIQSPQFALEYKQNPNDLKEVVLGMVGGFDIFLHLKYVEGTANEESATEIIKELFEDA